MRAFLWLAMVVAVANGQEFDVASVKSTGSETGRFTMNGGPGTADPGRISYTNIPLRRVLLDSFDVKNYQLQGPDWLNTLRFDITARLPDATTKEQFRAMMRNLLTARFRMAIRRETRELPVYALLPAKNGPKIHAEAAPAAPQQEQAAEVTRQEGRDGFPVVNLPSPGVVIETRNGSARITAKQVTAARFADFLSTRLERPVLDATHLTGEYSFALYFAPDGPGAAESPEPNIFTAVQEQLGLRLEARKAPVELVIVDRAEKIPVQN